MTFGGQIFTHSPHRMHKSGIIIGYSSLSLIHIFAITTDIIVGFPGESDEDFAETLDMVKRAGFEGAFTFIYSPRSGTPASKYKDDLPADVKKDVYKRQI